MAFINEYFTEADNEKYDLKRVCMKHNLVNDNFMHSRSWTIDRKSEAFLIKVWSHLHSEFAGYAFYFKGEWMFFEMRPSEQMHDKEKKTSWFRFIVKGFVAPEAFVDNKIELLEKLREAITASPGGPDYTYGNLSATIDFIRPYGAPRHTLSIDIYK